MIAMNVSLAVGALVKDVAGPALRWSRRRCTFNIWTCAVIRDVRPRSRRFGDSATRRAKQDSMFAEGNAWLDREFPKVDRLIRVRIR